MNSHDYRVKFAGLLEEYRTALIESYYDLLTDRESNKRIRKAREAVLEFVRQNRMKFKHRYTLADYFPRDAYQIISRKEGGKDEIEMIRLRLEKEACALRDEVTVIVESDKDGWNWEVEERKFQKLCKEYRATIVGYHLSQEVLKKKLNTIKKKLRNIYVHPTIFGSSTDHRLLNIIARPADMDEPSDVLDATLSREAYSLLDSLRSSLQRALNKRNK